MGRSPRGCRLPGTTALAAATLVLLVLLELAVSTARPSGLAVVGSLVVATAVTAWRLWRTNAAPVRAATGALVAATLLGQVLASSWGGPDAATPHWSPLGVLVCAVAATALVLVLLGDDAPTEQPGRLPYAL
jgi:hypothetical protein